MKYAATIYRSGSDLLTLINDILDLSKVEAGKLEINLDKVILTDLIDSLENKLHPLATQQAIILDIGLPSSRWLDGDCVKPVSMSELNDAFQSLLQVWLYQ